MSTTQHTGQLSVQKDTLFGTGMQENEDSVQKDTLFGTGIGEWHSRGSGRDRSRMGNDLIDIGRGDYRKTTPQERGL